MDYEIFKKNLNALIAGRGQTRSAAADALGVSKATLSRYLLGDRKPDLEYVVRIAEHYNTSVDWLLGLTGEKYNMMPPELQEVAVLYSVASPDDRRVVQTVLAKYRIAMKEVEANDDEPQNGSSED